MSDNVDVHDNPTRQRYQITVDGDIAGIAVYYLEEQHIVFVHTEVAIAYEGRGLGSRLARHALDDVRKRGLRVVPARPDGPCWASTLSDPRRKSYPGSDITITFDGGRCLHFAECVRGPIPPSSPRWRLRPVGEAAVLRQRVPRLTDDSRRSPALAYT